MARMVLYGIKLCVRLSCEKFSPLISDPMKIEYKVEAYLKEKFFFFFFKKKTQKKKKIKKYKKKKFFFFFFKKKSRKINKLINKIDSY